MRLKKHVLAMLGCLILFSSLAQQGSIDPYFNTGTGFDGKVNVMVEQPDHKILVGGDFTTFNGQAVAKIVRLNADGSLDANFTASAVASGDMRAIAVQPDGKIIIGGTFLAYGGTAANCIVRLNANGSLDPSFVVGTGLDPIGVQTGGVYGLYIEPDGKIVMASTAGSYYGAGSGNFMLRLLNTDGTQSAHMGVSASSGLSDGESSAASTVFGFVPYSTSRYIVAGNFVSIGISPPINKMASVTFGSFNSATGLSTGTLFNQVVSCIVKQQDGKIIVGGNFTNTGRVRIARFSTNGVTTTVFDPSFVTGTGVTFASGSTTAIVKALALQADGKIFMAGDFDTYNGTSINRIARLSTLGAIDAGFPVGTGLNGRVNGLLLQTNGNLLAGGFFTSYNGTVANHIVRLQAADRSIATTLSNSALCTGSTVNVPFTATNSFASDNVFTAQLSDASGSFANPVVIGSVTDAYSGTISTTLPANSAAGSGYRIRVVSSNPVFTGTDNGSDLSMSVAPSATITYPASPYTTGPGSAAVTFSGTAGGVFSSTNGLIIDAATGSIDLATSTPGSFPVTYTVAASGGCSLYTTTASVDLVNLFGATISYPGSPFCATTGTAPVFFSGTNGGTFTATPAGLSIDAVNGAIDLGASLPGTYTVRYGISALLFTTTTVSIRPPTFVDAPVNQVACAQSPFSPIIFNGAAGQAYYWTSSNTSIGLAASGTGNIVSFTALNSGTTPVASLISVTAIGGTGCEKEKRSAVFRLTVNPLPVLTAVPDQTLCAGNSTLPVSFLSNLAGTTTSWSSNNTTTGLNAAGTNNIPSFVAVNNSGVLQTALVTATPVAERCSGAARTFTIAVSPSAGTIAYTGSPYCQTGPAVPTRRGSMGGVFTSAAGLDLNPATGSVNLGASTPGTYTITYTVAASGGCSSTASANLTIKPQAFVNSIGNQVYCNNMLTTAVPFTGNAASYSWANTATSIGLAASGTGTSLPSFTTMNAGPAVQYAYVRVIPQGNGSTSCPGKGFTFRIAVNYCGPVTQAGDHSGDGATARMQQGFQVGPNPASGSVVIQNTGAEQGPFAVQLLSQYGSPIGKATMMNGTTHTLDISNLIPGSYLLKVTHVKTGVSFIKQVIKL